MTPCSALSQPLSQPWSQPNPFPFLYIQPVPTYLMNKSMGVQNQHLLPPSAPNREFAAIFREVGTRTNPSAVQANRPEFLSNPMRPARRRYQQPPSTGPSWAQIVIADPVRYQGLALSLACRALHRAARPHPAAACPLCQSSQTER
jgi:hypothetical protein